jgi:hypothetical protein
LTRARLPPQTTAQIMPWPAALRRRFRHFGQTRRLLRALEALVATQQAQTALLQRLTDELAPMPPAVTAASDATRASRYAADADVTFLNEAELAEVLAYRERVATATGHDPTEDECLVWLAEQETARGIASATKVPRV